MIPSILATALATTAGSAIAGRLKIFQPFLLIAGAIGALGCGLMLTFDLNPKIGAIIGYQILFGIGIGLGVQLPNLVATVTSSPEDVALTISSVACKYILGCSIDSDTYFCRSLHDACRRMGCGGNGRSFEQYHFKEGSTVCFQS